MRGFHNSPADSSEKTAENSVLPVETRHALAAWIRAKQNLERIMPQRDFQSLVRPMYLIAALSKCHLLIAIPPNKRLYERALHFFPNLSAAVERQNYHLAGFTRYPSDEELRTLRNCPSFAPFVELIWRKRLEKIEHARAEEDKRDSCDLRAQLEMSA